MGITSKNFVSLETVYSIVLSIAKEIKNGVDFTEIDVII